ncbi:uroporphyrinogen-III synthase [Sediminibacterium soli]|uniref:uroporphyrinogen-III synthase n=1 Tax=Sediminibacterium soli TaxID=2698829 RepID=UPI00137A688D|nr:uroporphyrinogen-III synthase [Sediminibacterium soli]NCI47333.1 uroporphyrinogen-III synthase [Sediminibacterium soli]
MQDYKATLLATRQVNTAWIAKAGEKNILLDIVPFIKTESILSVEVQQEIEQAATRYATVVFTSSAAVDVVTELLDGALPQWAIYCIGFQTKDRVLAYFGEDSIAGTAAGATLLADEIIAEEPDDEVIFFSGSHRRNELPSKLRNAGIDVNEIAVYQTALTPQQTEKTYDGILFFSPSSVQSFYIKNKMAAHTVVFAIGPTTAEAVGQFFPNKILTAAHPVKDEVVVLAIDYFAQQV